MEKEPRNKTLKIVNLIFILKDCNNHAYPEV